MKNLGIEASSRHMQETVTVAQANIDGTGSVAASQELDRGTIVARYAEIGGDDIRGPGGHNPENSFRAEKSGCNIGNGAVAANRYYHIAGCCCGPRGCYCLGARVDDLD